MAHSLSLESTTFLIHWDVHGSTVFIYPCLVCLSTFSGRITIAKGLDNSADFFWLGCLSTLLGRIIQGDLAAFASNSLWLGCLSTFSGRIPQEDLAAFAICDSGLLRIEIFRVSATSIDPKLWLPCFVSSRMFSLFSLLRLIFSTINWVMQSSILTSNWMLEWFTNRTFTSPWCYAWIRVGWQALPSGPDWGQGNKVFQVRGLLDGDKTLVAASGEGSLVTEWSPKVKGVSRTSYLLKVQVETCKVWARMQEGVNGLLGLL